MTSEQRVINLNDLLKFEQYIRDMSWEDFYKKFDYFTFKERGKGNYVTMKFLKDKFDNGGILKLWERLDPTSYYTAFDEYKMWFKNKK